MYEEIAKVIMRVSKEAREKKLYYGSDIAERILELFKEHDIPESKFEWSMVNNVRPTISLNG